MLAVSLAVPASAHGHGPRHQEHSRCVVAAAQVLGQTAQGVWDQVRASRACVADLVAQNGKLEEFWAEMHRIHQECVNNGSCPNYENCPNNGDCPNYGNGPSYEDCPNYENCQSSDGYGGQGMGQGMGQGRGGHHGGGHHGGCNW